MKSVATLILLSTVLGVDGDRIELDKGAIDGVRAGDVASFYYELAVGDERRRIDAGQGRVLAVEDFRAQVEAAPEASVRQGFRAELQIPRDRVSSEALQQQIMRLLDERTAPEEAPAAVSEELERELAQLRAQVAGAEQGVEEAARLQQQLEREVSEALAAAEQAAQRAAPPPSLTAPVITDAALGEGRRREDFDGMILVEGGVVTVGLDPPNARFYNQSPAFEAELAPFWIDETPISAARVHATHPGLELLDPRETGLALGVSQGWAEAYCRFLGKRLPSEIEWEAAMVSGALSPDPRAFEWTASWYQPYPGNEHTEPDYGEELKVIRGGMDPEHLELHERRHLDPQMGHRLVGFRCARDAGE